MNSPYPSVFDMDDVPRACAIDKQCTDLINTVLREKHMHDAATGNPMNTAIYFDEIVRCITEVILSYDNDRHQGKEKPGIFGHTTAYIGCSETQNSGKLQMKSLRFSSKIEVWASNFLKIFLYYCAALNMSENNPTVRIV